jgi:hypothetical protein
VSWADRWIKRVREASSRFDERSRRMPVKKRDTKTENEIVNRHLMAMQVELEQAGLTCEAVIATVFLTKVPDDWTIGRYLPHGVDYNVAFACENGEGERYAAATIEILSENISAHEIARVETETAGRVS